MSSILDPLLAALQTSPGNLPLWQAILAAGAAEPDRLIEAITSLRDLVPEDLPLRRQIGALALARHRPELALHLLPEATAEDRLARVRALLAAGRMQEAQGLYRGVLASAPALRDPEIDRSLGLTPPPAEPKGENVLRLVRGDAGSAEAVTGRAESVWAPREVLTFDDVAGLEEVKSQIRRKIVTPFLKPETFLRFRKRAGGGILLFGPPGVGKTLIARATAGECKAKFFAVEISDIISMYIGEAERHLTEIFETARGQRPSVLFFDELEALAGKRTQATSSSHATMVSAFLSQLDSGEKNRNEGMLIIGATNMPWAIDSAFKRPGRFDRVQFIPPPDQPAREAILRLHLRGRPQAPVLDLSRIARDTSGWSGADLMKIAEEATDFAIEEQLTSGQESRIEDRHLQAALKETRATTLDWLRTARNHAQYANESGEYDEVLAFLKKHGRVL